MKTIIQTIGPLYGDDVNGTVFGQPNGSVYTPSQNLLVVLNDNTGTVTNVRNATTWIKTSNGSTDGVAVTFQVLAQVDTWKFKTELSADSTFTNIVSTGSFTRPSGSSTAPLSMFGLNTGYTVVNGATYYARLVLTDLKGNTIAVSNTYTFKGIV